MAEKEDKNCEAEHHFLKAIQEDQSMLKAYKSLADLHYKLGQYDDAVTFYK